MDDEQKKIQEQQLKIRCVELSLGALAGKPIGAEELIVMAKTIEEYLK